MRVLVVYAHPNPKSFCHAILERCTAGLRAAEHDVEVLDLYASGFDPVFRMQDFAFFADPDLPSEVVRTMNPRQRVQAMAGGPIKKLLARLMLRNKSDTDVLKLIRERAPKDVLAHQRKVAWAEGMVLIAPIFWMGFPALLKGWIERVFAYGFAYSLTAEGWSGHVKGRVPLLKHKKALVISTTFFTEEDYREEGFDRSIETIIDDWTLRYPGVQMVEHAYFYAVRSVSDAIREDYLNQAYKLGKAF